MCTLFAGSALYFRDYLGAFLEKHRISAAFNPFSASELADTFANISALAVAERRFRECESDNICPEMTVIPSGAFVMGAVDDFYAEPEELPNTSIEITRNFAVSTVEVTEAQWETCFMSTQIGDGPKCKEIPNWNQNGGSFPVDSVSWSDAHAYVDWLNIRVAGSEAGPYRLLSEAEWEYAARAGTETVYFWGDRLLPGACEHANALNIRMPDIFVIPRQGIDCPNNPVLKGEVKTMKPNSFGLYDTSGNVAEWVQDCWHDDYTGRPTDSRAWENQLGLPCDRVIRGGSWFGLVDHLRPTSRLKLSEELFGFNVGFRVARDMDWELPD